jgi:CRP/FNR family transcriptional regulator, cyclic AMP receptor protein
MATKTDQKLELLKRAPLLAGLGRKDIEEVGRLVDEVDVDAGYVLIREGQQGREFFVIVSGTVQIDRAGTVIRTMGPGEFLGDIALLTEGPRTATATTLTPASLLVLGHREFHSLLDQFPSIRLAVLEALAVRIQDLDPRAAT